jgi:short-subunit dehydrogenase
MRRLEGRCLLVTGATGSLGAETAAALCSMGASLILPVRSEEKAAPLKAALTALRADAELSFPVLDLADEGSVLALTDALLQEGKPLDGLILNAGVFTRSGRTSPQGNEWHMQVNCLSPLLLTKQLLPLLRKAEDPCVVAVTSLSAFWPTGNSNTPTRLYAASKRALLSALGGLSAAGTGCTFVYAHPGVCATGLFRGSSEQTAYPRQFLRFALPLMEKIFPCPRKACRTTLHALTEGRSGQLAEPGGLLHIWGAPKLVALEKRLRTAK